MIAGLRCCRCSEGECGSGGAIRSGPLPLVAHDSREKLVPDLEQSRGLDLDTTGTETSLDTLCRQC